MTSLPTRLLILELNSQGKPWPKSKSKWPKSKWPKSSDPEPWPESDVGSFYSVADNSVSLVGDNADT